MHAADREILEQILEHRGGFAHREHLELAWNYLALHPPAAAYQALASAIRHVAALHGAPDKYHETITRSWVHLVALHRAGSQAGSFDEFILQNPMLLERHLLDRHYSRELIASDRARLHWAPPDLREIPSL